MMFGIQTKTDTNDLVYEDLNVKMLRDTDVNHLSMYVNVFSNCRMMRYNNTGEVKRVDECEAQFVLAAQNKFPFSYFICYYKDTPIGICSIYLSENEREVGFSFFVLPEYQRGGKGMTTETSLNNTVDNNIKTKSIQLKNKEGFGSQILQWIIKIIKKFKKTKQYGFENIVIIAALVNVDNQASLRVIKKAGFKEESVGFFRNNEAIRLILRI